MEIFILHLQLVSFSHAVLFKALLNSWETKGAGGGDRQRKGLGIICRTGDASRGPRAATIASMRRQCPGASGTSRTTVPCPVPPHTSLTFLLASGTSADTTWPDAWKAPVWWACPWHFRQSHEKSVWVSRVPRGGQSGAETCAEPSRDHLAHRCVSPRMLIVLRVQRFVLGIQHCYGHE